jgi:predicted dehydrogenase
MTLARLAAVCDDRRDRLDEVARVMPDVQTIGRFEDLLASQDVDAVVLATPAASHFRMSMAALEAGKHVLVEKPLAMTSEECGALDAAARASGLTLMVGHTFLYNSAVRWLREYIAGGQLGDVIYAYSQRLNLGQVRSDVDVMWNLAPHDISILLYLFDADPVAVTAHGQAHLQPGIIDVGLAVLEFADGRTAHVHVSWLDPRKVRRVTVVGSAKMVVYDDVDADARIQVYDKGIDRAPPPGDHADRPVENLGEHQMLVRSGDLLIPRIDFREPLRVELEDFVSAVSGGHEPLANARNGLRVVRVLEAASASILNDGARVELGHGP